MVKIVKKGQKEAQEAQSGLVLGGSWRVLSPGPLLTIFQKGSKVKPNKDTLEPQRVILTVFSTFSIQTSFGHESELF